MRIVVEAPDRYRVDNAENFSVRLEPVHGEEGRFHAFSQTQFRCLTCLGDADSKRTFTRRNGDGICQRCKQPGEPVVYLVDVVENRGRTKCSCENYTCNRRDIVTFDALTPCKHGAAALMLFGHFKAVDAANALLAKQRLTR